jgi:protein-S-isoprenylcysteine O-methyltransferase Ste14
MDNRHPIVPPIYFFAALLAETGLYFYAPILAVVPVPINLAGALLVVLGLALTLSAAGLFRRAGTPVRPFQRSTALVISGTYRITRNPMYLGMVLVLLGVAVLLGTASAFLPIPFFVWQIRRKFVLLEEQFLEGLFGQPYLDYKARVRRWL